MTSALEYVGGQRHTLTTPSPGNKRGIHFTGGWLALRVGLGDSKKSSPPPSPFESQTTQPAESQYADLAVMALFEHE